MAHACWKCSMESLCHPTCPTTSTTSAGGSTAAATAAAKSTFRIGTALALFSRCLDKRTRNRAADLHTALQCIAFSNTEGRGQMGVFTSEYS